MGRASSIVAWSGSTNTLDLALESAIRRIRKTSS